MDAAGSDFLHQWLIFGGGRGVLYLLPGKTNDPSYLFPVYLSLQDSPAKHPYFFLYPALQNIILYR